MIDAAALLSDLRKLVLELARDIEERLAHDSEAAAALVAEHGQALEQSRTSANFVDWQRDRVIQSAAAWVLATTFVRFLEDNGLLAEAWLSGPGDRGRHARDRLRLFFAEDPHQNERHYLLHVLGQVAKHPPLRALLDEDHNPLWQLQISANGAHQLLNFWQRRDSEERLIHDFSDPEWDTRFLGDLYQDLSEDVRKRYALLQTPDFVETFILDHTLTPALAEFGPKTRLIDPTCGSGHFLLGAFHRLLAFHQEQNPSGELFGQVQQALDGVNGVDLNPYAIAIARFRLLIAAMRAAHITRLEKLPNWRLHLAVGDSLFHGKDELGQYQEQRELLPGQESSSYAHIYRVEDRNALEDILNRRYHAVVGNPPYITVKDNALKALYKKRYTSTYMKYSLGVPFTERFFQLALNAQHHKMAGYIGLITANSFMKREFGKVLIRECFPRIELSAVIDTSGVYLPGHGTPTVILFGRNRSTLSSNHLVKTVMGIRGEPGQPENPAKGIVWRSIIELFSENTGEDEYVSVLFKHQKDFINHPWTLAGGGGVELKEQLQKTKFHLELSIESIGPICFSGQDEVFILPGQTLRSKKISPKIKKEYFHGEVIRDWSLYAGLQALTPYDAEQNELKLNKVSNWYRFLWQFRTNLLFIRSFSGVTRLEQGSRWWPWDRWIKNRIRVKFSITFAFVATHNHFVLGRGIKIFSRSAPVIKLPQNASEEDHLLLLGPLNSSVACFWMKQMFSDKGGSSEFWERRFEHDGTKLKSFPLPKERPLALARILDRLGSEAAAADPARVFAEVQPSRELLERGAVEDEARFREMVFYQEELDWMCYRLYGLIEEDLCYDPALPPVPLQLGERAFEVVMARQMAAGDLETAWFRRHGSTPRTDLPVHWPADYTDLVQRRLAAIERFKFIRLVEKPEYKRRWSRTAFDERARLAMRTWLADHLEMHPVWQDQMLLSTARLADALLTDAAFLEVAVLFSGREDVDLARLVDELVSQDAVPLQAACRYKARGLTKHEEWRRVWVRQREEDALDARAALPADHPEYLDAEALADTKAAMGPVTVPPKYVSGDFSDARFYKLRGKLDVPKERFFCLAGAETEGDPTAVVGPAGWDHLLRAAAVAARYITARDELGWPEARLLPLLVALAELIPWLRQWHNEPHPDFGCGLGDYYANFLAEELAAQGFTEIHINEWRPPKKGRGKKK